MSDSPLPFNPKLPLIAITRKRTKAFVAEMHKAVEAGDWDRVLDEVLELTTTQRMDDLGRLVRHAGGHDGDRKLAETLRRRWPEVSVHLLKSEIDLLASGCMLIATAVRDGAPIDGLLLPCRNETPLLHAMDLGQIPSTATARKMRVDFDANAPASRTRRERFEVAWARYEAAALEEAMRAARPGDRQGVEMPAGGLA